MFKARIKKLVSAVGRAFRRFIANDPQGAYEEILFEAGRLAFMTFGRGGARA